MIEKILAILDLNGSTIYACPHCRRYVKRVRGVKKCLGCYKYVDNNHTQNGSGKIIFTGGQSWLRHMAKSKIKMEPL